MFPTLVSGVGLLSVHFVFSGFPRTFNDKWWHAVPRLNRNTAYISLIYNNQVLFVRQFDTVKFPQSYNIQKMISPYIMG